MDNNLRIALRRLLRIGKGIYNTIDLHVLVLMVFLLKYLELVGSKNDSYENMSFPFRDTLSPRYLEHIYGRTISDGDIKSYLNSIEKYYGLEKNIVAGEVLRIIGEGSEECMRELFAEFNRLDIIDKSQLQVFSETLLYMLSCDGNRDNSIIINPSLSKLEAELISSKENIEIYDGYCGCGLSCNIVAAGKGIVYMQDPDKTNVTIAAILAILYENRIGKIRCGESIINSLSNEKFEICVSERIFTPKYGNENFEVIMKSEEAIYQPNTEVRTLSIRHSLAHLKPEGICTVLVPLGVLYAMGKTGKIRERLIADKHIDAVIELPDGIMPRTSSQKALLILKNNRADDSIFMVNTTKFADRVGKNEVVFSEENIKEIVNIYKERKVLEGISQIVSKQTLEENEYNLCTSQYVISAPEKIIEVTAIREHEEKYNELLIKLKELDDSLKSIRGRFID